MKKFFAVISLLFLLKAGLHAQTLSLEQARALVLANSRSLAKYELSIRSAVLDEKNQLYSMLPQVSADYSGTISYLRDFEFANPADTFSSGASLSITQIIFQGGKSFIQKAISSIATESVRKDALAEYYAVLDAADNAYYAVLEASSTLEAQESSLQSASLAFSIAEVRHSTGMINRGDYLKALADKEEKENSFSQARRNLALARTKLKMLTGIKDPFELERIDIGLFEQTLSRLSAVSDEEADSLYAVFWEVMEASNPSLAKTRLAGERAEKNHSLAKRDFAPTVSATVFSSGFNYSASGGFTTTSSGGLTIKGTIPLDFWVLNNRLEKSAIARDAASLDYQGALEGAQTELQSALLNAFAQSGAVLSTRRSLEYTGRHYDYVMERYRLSQSSVGELTDASSLLITSRNAHIKATYSFLQSLSRLRSLCALDDEEKLLELLSR